MNEVSRSPFDFESVRKGMTIPADVIEAVVKVPRTQKRYDLAKLEFVEAIKHYHLSRGVELSIRHEGDGIHVNTDAEQSEYEFEQSMLQIRRFGRKARLLHGVDVSQLTPEERQLHEARNITTSRIAQSLAQAGTRIRLQRWKPSRPGLPSQEEKPDESL